MRLGEQAGFKQLCMDVEEIRLKQVGGFVKSDFQGALGECSRAAESKKPARWRAVC